MSSESTPPVTETATPRFAQTRAALTIPSWLRHRELLLDRRHRSMCSRHRPVAEFARARRDAR